MARVAGNMSDAPMPSMMLSPAGLPEGPVLEAEATEENGHRLMACLLARGGGLLRAVRDRSHGGGRAARARFGGAARRA